jgi:hypothetical protein
MFSMRRLTGNLSEIASRIRQGRIKQIRADLPDDFPAIRDNSLLFLRPAPFFVVRLRFLSSAHRSQRAALRISLSTETAEY